MPSAIGDELDTSSSKASVQRIEIDSSSPKTWLVRTDKPRFLQREVPRMCLEAVVEKYAFGGIRDIALGYNGSYVILAKGSALSWFTECGWLRTQLKGPKTIKVCELKVCEASIALNLLCIECLVEPVRR